MLYEDLFENWKFWRKIEGKVEVDKLFMKRETGEEYSKKVPRGENDNTFKAYLSKSRSKYLKKYNARKHKVCMCSRFVKPMSLYVDSMSSRLKILNNHLNNFPLPDNQSIS